MNSKLFLFIFSFCIHVVFSANLNVSGWPEILHPEENITLQISANTSFDHDTLYLFQSQFSSNENSKYRTNTGLTIALPTGKKSTEVEFNLPYGIPFGFNYFKLINQDSSLTSQESKVLLRNVQFPTFVQPSSDVNSLLPTFEWIGANEVPAWHILVSTAPFTLNQDSLSSGSILWQSIQTKSKIQYGQSPVSMSAIPLQKGKTYYYLLAPNYNSNDPGMTDWSSSSTGLFRTPKADPSDSSFQIISPNKDQILNASNDSLFLFRWNRGSTSNRSFKIQVFAPSTFGNRQFSAPIFDAISSDTSYTLNIRRTFTTGTYTWIVSSLNENGNLIQSSTSKFEIKNQTRTLTISVQGISGNDTIPVPGSKVSLLPRNGELQQECVVPKLNAENFSCSFLTSYDAVNIQVESPNFPPFSTRVSYGTSSLSIPIVLKNPNIKISGKIETTQKDPIENCKISLQTFSTTGKIKTQWQTSNEQGVWNFSTDVGMARLQIFDLQNNMVEDLPLSLNNDTLVSILTTLNTSFDAEISGTLRNNTGASLSGIEVSLYSSHHLFLKKSVSDLNGNFSFFVQPGNYILSIENSATMPWSKSIRVAKQIHIDATLQSGASIVEGAVFKRTIFRSFSDGDSSVIIPQPNRTLFAVSENSTDDTLWTQTKSNGQYRISLNDIGKWTLGIRPEFANEAIETRNISVSYSGQSFSSELFFLQGLGGIRGDISLPLDASFQSSEYSVFLLDSATKSFVAQGTMFNKNPTTLQYEFQNIPQGSYQILVGAVGLSQDSLQYVHLFSDKGAVGPTLILSRSIRNRSHILLQKNDTLDANIEILFPSHKIIRTNEQISDLGSGFEILNIIPDNPSVLPLIHQEVNLISKASVDTTFVFQAKAHHAPKDTIALDANQDSLTLVLHSEEIVDSTLLYYRFSGNWNRILKTNLSDSSSSFTIFVPKTETNIEYYFESWKDQRVASNQIPYRHFKTALKQNNFFTLSLENQDSMNVSTNSTIYLHAHLLNAYNQIIDSKWNGNISWNILQGNSVSIENSTQLNATLKTTTKMGFSNLACIASQGSLHDTIYFSVNVNQISIQSLQLVSYPKSEIKSGDSLLLKLIATDSIHPQIGNILVTGNYSVYPENAGTFKDGKFILEPNFIGPLQISAESSLTDTLLLDVQAEVNPQNNQLLFQYDSTVTLQIPKQANRTNKNIRISLLHKESDQLAHGLTTQKILNGLWGLRITNGGTLNLFPQLGLAPSQNASTSIPSSISLYQDSSSQWTTLDSSSATQGTLSKRSKYFATTSPTFMYATTQSWNIDNWYALLGTSLSKGIQELTFLPNPFSPYITAMNDGNTRPGVRILFTPKSSSGNQLSVSIKIYNSGGELVKTLLNHQMMPQQLQSIYWDGIGDSGRLLRNGRYLVHFSTQESARGKNVQNQVKSLVLFK